jgi:hypothetical protein
MTIQKADVVNDNDFVIGKINDYTESGFSWQIWNPHNIDE